MREQQFADLTRGYEQSKANYDELLKKKNSSQMATSMELLQQGEHFQMIDPPSLPLKPDFPNRLKFCGIGLGIGIALGAALAGGTEFLDDRLYDEKALKDYAADQRDFRHSGHHQRGRRKEASQEVWVRLGRRSAGFYCYSCRISSKLLPRLIAVHV